MADRDPSERAARRPAAGGGDLLAEARALLPEVIELRRAIHAEPELGLDLPRTREKIEAALAELDLELSTGGSTAQVSATLRGRSPGPTLLLRADMDALPMQEDTGLPFASREAGRMHACGHDAHVAMLVGAARLLERRRGELPGNVRFLFQPGEEGHGGARILIEEGLLERDPRPDAAFALHVDPTLAPGTVATRPGPILAAADVFSAEVRGRGGHASMPHHAADPIPVAAEVVLALQSLVTRRVDVFDPVVLSVTRVQAGTTYNVIPEGAQLLGTLRSVSERGRALAREGLDRVVRGVAAAHGLEGSVQLIPGYPVTVNDDAFAAFVLDVAAELLGPRRALTMRAPIMGAEDFSYILQRVPGAMAFLGVKPEGEGPPAPIHSNRMILDEEALAVGVAMHAAVTLRYLEAAKQGAAPGPAS